MENRVWVMMLLFQMSTLYLQVFVHRDTSRSVPMNVQAEAAFKKVSDLQVRMGHEFEQ